MPQGPRARTVGARLREAREKRGISLQQIASNTRISVMSLEALERSDLSRLPGGIFTRAFIRAYAEEVGLDPDRTMQDFISELPAGPAIARPAQAEDGEKLEADRKAVSTAIRLVLVSVPLAALIVYFSSRARVSSPEVGLSSAGPGLTIEISSTAPCWVSATADGRPRFSSLLNPGETRVVRAREDVLLKVGDAGAVSYTINGVAAEPIGAPGEAVTRRISVANYKQSLVH